MCFVIKTQYFEGVKFTRDDKSGYYLNSTIRKRMHRYVWEYHNGVIPEGYHIHHIDGDKANNDISNLQLIEASEHATMHGKERASREYDVMIKNLNEKARPKASEWHGSKEGKEWHKKQYEDSLGKHNSTLVEFVCKCCNSSFKAIRNGTNRFCSNKCKSKHRRISGVDDVVRACDKCGKEFKINKYSKTKKCSLSCIRKKV